MKISKEKILRKGNESLAIATVFSISSLSCPCPMCIGTAILCFANSVREKLGFSLPGFHFENLKQKPKGNNARTLVPFKPK